MIPRGSPDIGWHDLCAGLCDCVAPPREEVARAQAEAAMGCDRCLACLSVRSGLDVSLQALALPPGSEVLVSAVTIPGMVHVLEHHGLVAVPVDLDMERLTLDLSALAKALTSRTRAILVAHLFGSQMDLTGVAAFAHSHRLVLLEDCAQAYDGCYIGCADSDIVMFSFGSIKTSTALGGAMLRFRDAALLARARTIQARYPVQPIRSYLRRILIFLGLKVLAHPLPLAVFVAFCRLTRQSHDTLITGLLRGFPGTNLIARLRYRPCSPLLAMLMRRLKQSPAHTLTRRIILARALIAALPKQQCPGTQAEHHTYWAMPVLSANPDELARQLWAIGIDASRSASSLYVVASPPGRPRATCAAAVMDRLLYLPLHPALNPTALQRVANTIAAFERNQAIASPQA
ncbi:MAG: DegT/DnrJ/EryC1/StrS aminotransferase family protein [Oscillochloris sp.]|nr:DegT/DnrJ/EryC1/StrS aminotransferase family protein [Oscillochloris sp.]